MNNKDLVLFVQVTAAMKERGLSIQALSALIGLSEGGMSIGELGKSIGVLPGSMSRIIWTLYSRGWVDRIGDTADHRSYRVSITEAGRNILDSI